MTTAKTVLVALLVVMTIFSTGCSGVTAPVSKAEDPASQTDAVDSLKPAENASGITDAEAVKLCAEYVTALFGAELQGKTVSLDYILSEGAISNYVSAKMSLLADRRYEATNSLENTIITCAATDIKRQDGDVFITMAVTLSYQNNGVGNPIERSDDFYFRLIGEGEDLRIADVFNHDSIDTDCRGITQQSTLADSGITDAHVKAVESYFDTLNLPTKEEIISMSEYNRLIALGESTQDETEMEKAVRLHMQALSPSEFMLLVAQASYQMDSGEVDDHAFMLFLRDMFDKFIPTMRESDFADVILNADYSDSFRWFMMDFYRIYSEAKGENGHGVPQNSEVYEAALAQLAADATQSEDIRIDAAGNMSITSDKKAVLLSLFNEMSGENKTYLHQTLNREFPETIMEIAGA